MNINNNVNNTNQMGNINHTFNENSSIGRTFHEKMSVSIPQKTKIIATLIPKLIKFILKNLTRRINGFINSHTIIKGSSIKWDHIRIKNGKHKLFKKIKAEHVNLKGKKGYKVDAHYFDAEKFMYQLEKWGGKRLVFQYELSDKSIFSGNKCLCEIEGDFPVEMQEIQLKEKQKEKDKWGDLLIRKYISSVSGEQMRIIHDKKTGKFYLMDLLSYNRLANQKYINSEDQLIKGNIKTTDKKVSSLPDKMRFPGIKFDKNTSQKWEKAEKILREMKIYNSAWTLVDTKDALYLVPREHKEKIELAVEDNEGITLIAKPVEKLPNVSERGAVLLTMNTDTIYEQWTDEMLTFMLKGLNVMVYNNPGKGLSTGPADRSNINSSIDTAYQFLKRKNIPDEKILAKGQCFGGAPTAWLSKQHPKINVMLDQNPANFYEVPIKRVNATAEKLMAKNRNKFVRYVGKILKDNFLIRSIAKSFLGGYDVPSDLAYNKGNKLLHINVPRNGAGGDQKIPDHHPEMMINSISDTDGKTVSLSMNPGGTHVTHWWSSKESEDVVTRFLERTGLSQTLFYPIERS